MAQWKESQRKKTETANSNIVNGLYFVSVAIRSSDNEYNSELSIYLCAATSISSIRAWGLDTMCSSHLTPCKDMFIGEITPTTVPIEVANGNTIYSKGLGDVRIFWKNPQSSQKIRSTILRNVLYVPDASISLISLGVLVDKGSKLNCDSNGMSVYSNAGKLLFKGVRSNGVWTIPNPIEFANSIVSEANIPHD